ncbi:MAG TPA: hydrogenase maturation protease, partial [Methanocella sp.]|nr:hydrogenase maturation protease [Methanocella sp.]
MRKIVVLGVGNLLMGDDGFGPRVLDELRKRNLPPNVELIDAGVGGMSILSWIEDADKVIIIDSIHFEGYEVGDIVRFTDKELPPPTMFGLSLHDINLVDTLKIGQLVQKMPEEIVIYGVQIDRIAEFTMEMTPEVEEA